MTPELLLAILLFSETKDIDDAKAIANVVLNRAARPQRFGQSLEEVIYAPYQFSGVGGTEWEKAETGKLTKKEKEIFTAFQDIANKAVAGTLEKVTDADHYFNPKLSNPSWGKVYPKVYSTDSHDYYREAPPQEQVPGR